MRTPSKRSHSRALGVALALGAALPLAAAAGAVQRVGRPAQAFVLENPSGGETTLAGLRGKPLLLNVYAAWCGTCRIEEARLISAYERFGSRVTFLGVDEQEGAGTALAFARQMGVPYAIALDGGQFAATYGATKIPETIFIDAHGIVRSIVRGGISEGELERALRAIAKDGGSR